MCLLTVLHLPTERLTPHGRRFPTFTTCTFARALAGHCLHCAARSVPATLRTTYSTRYLLLATLAVAVHFRYRAFYAPVLGGSLGRSADGCAGCGDPQLRYPSTTSGTTATTLHAQPAPDRRPTDIRRVIFPWWTLAILWVCSTL